MEKTFSLTFLGLIVSSLFLSNSLLGINDYSEPLEILDNPHFAYDVKEDDEFIYNVNSEMDIGFSDNKVYDEFDKIFQNLTLSQPMFADFELKQFLEDYNDYSTTEYQMKYQINDIFQEINSKPYDPNQDDILLPTVVMTPEEWDIYIQTYKITHDDVFNGSIQSKLNKNDDKWSTPETIYVNQFDKLAKLIKKNLNLSTEETASMETTFNEAKEQLVNSGINWNNQEISRILGPIEKFFGDNTTIPNDIDPLSPIKPEPDFNGVSNIPYFLPNDWKFDDWMAYLEDYFDYYIEDLEEVSLTSSINNFEELKGFFGINQLTAQEKAIGIYVNLQEFGENALTSMLGAVQSTSSNNIILSATTGPVTEPGETNTQTAVGEDDNSISENPLILVGLSNLGINSFSGGLGFAMEYDEDMSLLSFAIHIKGILEMNLTGMANTFTEIDDLDLSMEGAYYQYSYTITKDGYYPPSLDQIQNGELGTERDPTKNPIGFWDRIPGYSTPLIGIIGIVSIVATIRKYRSE